MVGGPKCEGIWYRVYDDVVGKTEVRGDDGYYQIFSVTK